MLNNHGDPVQERHATAKYTDRVWCMVFIVLAIMG